MSEFEQLTFDLPHRPALSRADFLVSDSNSRAVAAVDGWQDWPGARLALTGPARSGKSHLVHVWAGMADATITAALDLGDARIPSLAAQPVAVEDVDRLAQAAPARRRLAEEALLHLYNLMAETRRALLVTGAGAPAAWQVLLPDLRSRLEPLPLVEIEPPDDNLLSSLLVKLFADRQVRVEPRVIRYMVARMERSCEGAEKLVALIDSAALEQKRNVTVDLVRKHAGWAE
ncbi:MAG: DnaA/Hda family protein [Pseudomonadota bacterium]